MQQFSIERRRRNANDLHIRGNSFLLFGVQGQRGRCRHRSYLVDRTVCQVYTAPTIAPTVTPGDKQHSSTIDVETSSRIGDSIKNSDESLSNPEEKTYQTESKLSPNTESSLKTTITVEEGAKTNSEKSTVPVKEPTTTSKLVESATEKLNDDKVVLETESLKSINREETEKNEKSVTDNKEYSITGENSTPDPIRKDVTEDEQREDEGNISPHPVVSDFMPDTQTDDIIGGPVPESEIVTADIIGTGVFPVYIPETLPDEPIEPQETSMEEEEEEEEMDPNPPSIIPDDALLDINDDPLPIADDIVEEVPENPPEKMGGEEEDSGPINII
ncbi:immunoglobulin A1 protease autotransporter-like [Centruroides vittatus]|uniref:immunoglobulin A1 protease autotransporter-like n=1 Tax=Centruroides vittatus TaxID=120091 RepID=UPI0035108A2F